MANSIIKYLKEDNNAQVQGNIAVNLTTSDINIALKTLTSSNDFCHLTNNGALSFDKSGTYLLIGTWGFNGLSSGNVISVSIRKWRNSAYSLVDVWGTTGSGTYLSVTQAIIADLNVGEALFLSARNNSGNIGTFNFGRIIAIKLL